MNWSNVFCLSLLCSIQCEDSTTQPYANCLNISVFGIPNQQKNIAATCCLTFPRWNCSQGRPTRQYFRKDGKTLLPWMKYDCSFIASPMPFCIKYCQSDNAANRWFICDAESQYHIFKREETQNCGCIWIAFFLTCLPWFDLICSLWSQYQITQNQKKYN